MLYTYAWQIATLLFGTLLPLGAGAYIAWRYRKLSPYTPLIAGGFGLMALFSICSTASSMYLMYAWVNNHYAAAAHYSTVMHISSVVFTLWHLGAWSLLLVGLSLTLRDLQRRLQPIGNVRAAQETQTRPSISPTLREYKQDHAVNSFAAPIAPQTPSKEMPQDQPDTAPVQPVRYGATEQPEQSVTLGSTH